MHELFEKFYSEYKNKLYSYLVYKSGDREIALDITQESFTRHFQKYANVSTNSPSLLFTIARNALVDHQRSQFRFQQVEHTPPQEIKNEEQAFIAREDSDRIYKAIGMLPEQDKELLSMAVNGIAYKEIAVILGLSVATVKVRIHRSRTRLRQILSREEK